MKMHKFTVQSALAFALLAVGINVLAAGGSVTTLPAKINSKDTISLQRGAQTYMNYCLACHSMQYMRYDTLVEYLHIPEEIVEQNLMFSGDKVTDHITNTVPAAQAQAWFGKVPPDLTLVARVRGADWLYTYMKSFYQDPDRPFGVNNTVFKDVGMPHVLSPLQGMQIKTAAAADLQNKIAAANVAMAYAQQEGNSSEISTQRAIINESTAAVEALKMSGEYFELASEGSLTAEEYDTVIRDLVNFLDFAGEPGKVDRHALGVKVIIFLLVFFMFAYFLKQEYWKDVH
ncbi:MAG: cytochrome c1 [Gammaproteobacteria bacterium]|jgi:ubiquinol-cytochrome c reductase cytochrome c1 subunit